MRMISLQKGVGLIEVLVTLLILSTALLSLSVMQLKSLQFNNSAYFRSQANILAYDMFERMRSNRLDLTGYNVAAAPFVASAPSGSQAQLDVYDWRQTIDDRLPGGQGSIACVPTTQVCTMTITWNEINQSGVASEDTSTFVTMAKIFD